MMTSTRSGGDASGDADVRMAKLVRWSVGVWGCGVCHVITVVDDGAQRAELLAAQRARTMLRFLVVALMAFGVR